MNKESIMDNLLLTNAHCRKWASEGMMNIDVREKAVAWTEESLSWKKIEQGLRAQTAPLPNSLDLSVPNFLAYKMVYLLPPL